GFGIFLLSWLIVYTVLRFVSFNFGAVNSGSWWKIECDTRSYFQKASDSSGSGGGGDRGLPPTGQSGDGQSSKDPGSGTCDPVPSGPCSVENLSSTCFSNNTSQWSQICNIESRGNANSKSAVDKCKNDDGKEYPFSIGLFQINMLVHAKKSGCDSGIFSGSTGNCKVLNVAKYEECVKKLQNPENNIRVACEVSGGGKKFRPWLNSSKKCGINY
ncbi:MAG TPA: hypothetical protein GX706_00420, partial [Candidatus Moranbacteria bacterium]|nr:hypothetical protein [Candidatus Moranbacteria bacterium]